MAQIENYGILNYSLFIVKKILRTSKLYTSELSSWQYKKNGSKWTSFWQKLVQNDNSHLLASYSCQFTRIFNFFVNFLSIHILPQFFKSTNINKCHISKCNLDISMTKSFVILWMNYFSIIPQSIHYKTVRENHGIFNFFLCKTKKQRGYKSCTKVDL